MRRHLASVGLPTVTFHRLGNSGPETKIIVQPVLHFVRRNLVSTIPADGLRKFVFRLRLVGETKTFRACASRTLEMSDRHFGISGGRFKRLRCFLMA